MSPTSSTRPGSRGETGTNPCFTSLAATFRAIVGVAASAAALMTAPQAVGQAVCDTDSNPYTVPEPPGHAGQLEWWPIFGFADSALGQDPCSAAFPGHVSRSIVGNNEVFAWQSGRSTVGDRPNMSFGSWVQEVHAFSEDQDDAPGLRLPGPWSRTPISTGSRLNVSLLWAPSPGDFLNPAPTIGQSSFALVSANSHYTPTDFNGITRPTLDGVVDLVTGAPLVQVTDLTIPFGGAEFRLTRTRSSPPSLDVSRETEDSEWPRLPMDNDYYATDQWWDWAGIGWMASENPLLVIDSSLADVVGTGPRTTWFIPDALHSVPFQLIESNGRYEAPPRFRARLEHNGAGWISAEDGWATPPTQYRVSLYEGRVTYTFVVIREDTPPNAFDPDRDDGVDECVTERLVGDPPVAVPYSLHDRPYLPNVDGQADDWDPRDTRYNPGIGMPYYGLCVRIEDELGHRADIAYCGVRSSHLPATGPGNCAECWEDGPSKGQISHIKLSAPDGQGIRSTLWTLLYAHRSFRGSDRTDLVRADGHPSGDPVIPDPNHLGIRESNLDPGATFHASYAEPLELGDAHEDLYAMRGQKAIDRIYAYEGDLDLDSETYWLTIGHLDRLTINDGGVEVPSLDGGTDPVAGLSAMDHSTGLSVDLATGWTHMVRYHYELQDGSDRTLDRPLLVKTTVHEPELGPTRNRVYHYRAGETDTDCDNHVLCVPNPSADSVDSAVPWLEVMFSDDDLGRIARDPELGLTIDQVARWKDNPYETNPGLLTKELAEKLRRHASVRWNARPVDVEGVRKVDIASAWVLSDKRWAKPDPLTLWESADGEPYLLNSQSSVVSGEEATGDNPELHAGVETLSVRRANGTIGHYRLHKLLHLPKDYGPTPPASLAAQFGGSYPRHRSIRAHPYRWLGWAYPDRMQSSITSLGSDGILDPAYTDAGDLALARWITIVDDFSGAGDSPDEARDAMVSTDDEYDAKAYKRGLQSRRVVEMNPAGYVLRDRSWQYSIDEFGNGTVESSGEGRGKEYIYATAQELFDAVSQGSQLANASPSVRDSILIAEERSVGWSAAKYDDDPTTDPRDRGMVTFYEYALFGDDDHYQNGEPWTDRVQLEAVGIKEGMAWAWDTAEENNLFVADQLIVNNEGGPRLYQRQYVRDPDNPTVVTADIQFLTPATAKFDPLALDGPAPWALPPGSNHVAITVRQSEYEESDEGQRLTSTLVVRPRQQTRPEGPWLYPVDKEFYDACGRSTWSYTGLVADPASPLAGSGEPTNIDDEVLVGTYRSYDSRGRTAYEVIDADPDTDVTVIGPDPTESMTLRPPPPPDSAWGHLGSDPLSYTTSYWYNGPEGTLSDIYFPPKAGEQFGRRWAKRVITVHEDLGPVDAVRTDKFYREFYFNDLIYDQAASDASGFPQYTTDVPGRVVDQPFPWPLPDPRRNLAIEVYGNQMIARQLDYQKRVRPTPQPTADRTVLFQDTAGANLPIALDFDEASAPTWVPVTDVEYKRDSTGRLAEASQLEYNRNGQLLATNFVFINDLGEVYREEVFDGTVTRMTRNPLGFNLRRYVGTDDEGWADQSPQGGYNMVLAERTEYGSSPDDTWLPTVVRTYRENPSWALDYYIPPDEDLDGYATVTTYDWRQRPVRVDTYDKGDPFDGAPRLSTTLTYFDHANRPRLVARYGGGALNIPPGVDPRSFASTADLPDLADLYAAGDQGGGAGHNLLSLTESIYDVSGNPTETREYDLAWDGSGAAPYHATYAFRGFAGATVYAGSPESGLRRTTLDGIGRTVAERTVDPADEFRELARTEYVYDGDAGNIIEVRSFVRTDDSPGSADALTATGPDANAVRTRMISWYDRKNRKVAEAELGTEQAAGWVGGPEAYTDHDASESSRPAWDPVTRTVDRKGLPPSARLMLTVYNNEGQVELEIDPAGVVTRHVYGQAGRLTEKIQHAYVEGIEQQLRTYYAYKEGRLVSMSVPRRSEYTPPEDPNATPGAWDDDEWHESTLVSYGAAIVDEDFNVISRNNGLVGGVYIRNSEDPVWPLGPYVPPPHGTVWSSGPGPLGVGTRGPDLIFAYTNSGQVAIRRDRRNVLFLYAYDALDRLESIRVAHMDEVAIGQITETYPPDFWPSGVTPPSAVQRVEFEYDERHRLHRVTARNELGAVLAQTERGFDARDNLTAEWQAIESLVSPTTPAVAYAWDYAPTDHNTGEPGYQRLASMDYPDPGSGSGAGPRRISVGYGSPGSYDDRTARVRSAAAEITGTPGTSHPLIAYTLAGDGRRTGAVLGSGAITQSYHDGVTPGLAGLDMFGAVQDLLFTDHSATPLYRGQHTYDARGQLVTQRITQPGTGLDNARSRIHRYDELNRLVHTAYGVLEWNGSEPAIDTTQPYRSDSWSLDAVGNWSGIENPVDYNGDGTLNADDADAFTASFITNDITIDDRADLNNDGALNLNDVELFSLLWFAGADQPGRRTTGHLDGWDTPWALPSADGDTETWETTLEARLDNTIGDMLAYDSDANPPDSGNHTAYDAAGNLLFDGTYGYLYDAWGRLLAVHQAQWTGGSPAYGPRLRSYLYDGLGRHIRTVRHDAGGDVTLHHHYDGVRRIQDRADAAGPLTVDREYVWGFGGAVDELVAEYAPLLQPEPFFAIHDIAGDLVALVNPAGGTAQIAGQWTYDPYGAVLTAETPGPLPERRLGHKGLFFDRLDGAGPGQQLWPHADVVYHVRNRAYRPELGRWLQRDPNSTAHFSLTLGYLGTPIRGPTPGFGFEEWLTDGQNLFGYLGSNPTLASDPAGLVVGLINLGGGSSIGASINEHEGDAGVRVLGGLSALLAGVAPQQVVAAIVADTVFSAAGGPLGKVALDSLNSLKRGIGSELFGTANKLRKHGGNLHDQITKLHALKLAADPRFPRTPLMNRTLRDANGKKIDTIRPDLQVIGTDGKVYVYEIVITNNIAGRGPDIKRKLGKDFGGYTAIKVDSIDEYISRYFTKP